MSNASLSVVQTDESRRTGMGARIEGVDLAAGVTPEIIAAIRQAVLDYPVIAIPGQSLDPVQLMTFARNFGELQVHTAERYRHPEHPELSFVSNIDRDGKIDEFGHNTRATGWHSDGSFLELPYSLTMLYSVEAPSQGGPTLFANMRKTYERLPAELKARLEGATAVHALASGYDGATAPSAAKRHLYPEVEKPAILVHPENGTKAVFLNAAHTSHLLGMDREESDRLIREVVEFATSEPFVYAHYWKPGDLVIWDQRCTMHRAGGGLSRGERRVMLRALVRGLVREAAAA
jgi:taurine dioxygenase